MRILIVYQHYSNPDCASRSRLYAFLQHLGQHHEITLLTTSHWYNQRITHVFDWVPSGVTAHMFDVPYTNQAGVLGRIRPYVSFPLRAGWKARALPKHDLVYGISTPLTVGWAAARIARRWRVPWVFELRDLWPDFPIQMGAMPWQWAQQKLYRLEKKLYADACHVITASPDMTTHVQRQGLSPNRVTTLLQGTNLDVLSHSTAPDLDDLRSQYQLHDKKVVLYAGTFGRANDIPTLLEAARLLSDRPDLTFAFMGSGYHASSILDAAQSIPSVLYLAPQARVQALAWFKLAALSLCPFIDLPVLATNAPAKFCDSLAAGTPVIVTNPGWTQHFVETHACGWYVPPSQPTALAAQIQHLLDQPDVLHNAGRNGARVAQEQFDRSTMAAQLDEIMRQCARTSNI